MVDPPASSEQAATRHAGAAPEDPDLKWRALIEAAPFPIMLQEGGLVTWVNEALMQLMRASSRDQVVGRSTLDFTHPDDRAVVQQRRAQVQSSDRLPRIDMRLLRCDGTVAHVEVMSRVILRDKVPVVQIALFDLQARKEVEEARRRSEVQAQVIEAQAAMLRELSTPLIPLGDGAVVVPLVGRITDERAAAIHERLAAGVVEQAARVVIVDLTGVPEADAGVAEFILRAVGVVRLLGAEVILTGIKPSIANRLVEDGVDLRGVSIRGTVRDGIQRAMARRAAPLTR
jgi:rsbT co-antagonist protein RsbR